MFLIVIQKLTFFSIRSAKWTPDRIAEIEEKKK